MCTAVKQDLGVSVVKTDSVPGRFLVLDLSHDDTSVQILNVYALNNAHACKLFFHDMESLITDYCMVLGDFNSYYEPRSLFWEP